MFLRFLMTSAFIALVLGINIKQNAASFRPKENTYNTALMTMNLVKLKKDYEQIGEGAEMIVFDNNDTVIKVSHFDDVDKYIAKNEIPNFLNLELIGYTKESLPIFTQQKVIPLNEEQFYQRIQEVDSIMNNHGFSILDNSYIQYRAYTNGEIVVDDISPDNLGIDYLGNIKLIDCSVLELSEWIQFCSE